MNKTPNPKVTRDHSLPLVWIVPIIAALICAWLGYREFRDLGPEVSIHFADASGVEAGRTTLEYKGVAVGIVKSVELRKGLVGITIKLRLKKEAAELANGGSRFWIVHPEIGLSGVHGLETLVSGVRLNVSPGNGPTTKEFEGLDKTPAPDVTDEGRSFILKSDRLGSLTTGAPVFYRELKVGAVEASRLSSDSTQVLIRIHIDAPYAELVRANTRFWNAGGFNFKINLFGAQLKDTSLESLVTGGVAFATPDAGTLAAAADADTVFDLSAEADKEWLKWSPKIPIKSVESVVQKPSAPSLIPSLMK